MPVVDRLNDLWAQHKWIALLVLVGIIVVTVLASIFLPVGIDWESYYYPAARGVFSGHSPYDNAGFVYPAWAVLPMLPLSLLPVRVGRAAWFVVSALAFAYIAYRMGARPLALGLFVLSPPVLHCLLNGNLDWLVLLGLVFPPQIGLFFILIKPQIGSVVVLWWLVEAWREKGFREVIRVFAPVSVALLLTFLLFGLWPLAYLERVDYWWNASLWPASIPIGLALAVASLRRRNVRYALAASPALSPYVLLHSWAGALVALVEQELEFAAAVAGLWILVVLRVVAGAF